MNEEQPATSNQQPATSDRRTFLKSSLSKTFLAANAAAFAGLINTPGIVRADGTDTTGADTAGTDATGTDTVTTEYTEQTTLSPYIEKFRVKTREVNGYGANDQEAYDNAVTSWNQSVAATAWADIAWEESAQTAASSTRTPVDYENLASPYGGTNISGEGATATVKAKANCLITSVVENGVTRRKCTFKATQTQHKMVQRPAP